MSTASVQHIKAKLSPWAHTLLKQFFYGSPALWCLYFILWMISFVVVPSALAKDVFTRDAVLTLVPIMKHFFFLILSIVVTVGISLLPTAAWRGLGTWMSIIIAVIFTVWLWVDPHIINGSARWVELLWFSIQPSELVKVAVVLSACMISSYTRKMKGTRARRNVFLFYWVFFLIISLSYATENLSTSVLLITSLLGCSLLVLPPWRSYFRLVSAMALAGIVAGGLLLFLDQSYLRSTPFERAVTWQNRIHDALNGTEVQGKEKYEQKDYAMMAVARGGEDLGIKFGDESKLSQHLPMAASDFVYSIIVEKWGLLGAVGIPALYLWWCYLCYRLSTRTRSVLKRSLALCIGFAVPLQALLNLIIGSGIFVTGQTLPLISSGGTSIVTTSLLMGILLSISRESIIEEEAEDLEEVTEEQTYTPAIEPNE